MDLKKLGLPIGIGVCGLLILILGLLSNRQTKKDEEQIEELKRMNEILDHYLVELIATTNRGLPSKRKQSFKVDLSDEEIRKILGI